MTTDEAKRIVAEETWEEDADEDDANIHLGESGWLVYEDGIPIKHRARARIAACAPEALRMLLDNEWAGGGQPSGYCLDCGAARARRSREHPACEVARILRDLRRSDERLDALNRSRPTRLLPSKKPVDGAYRHAAQCGYLGLAQMVASDSALQTSGDGHADP